LGFLALDYWEKPRPAKIARMPPKNDGRAARILQTYGQSHCPNFISQHRALPYQKSRTWPPVKKQYSTIKNQGAKGQYKPNRNLTRS